MNSQIRSYLGLSMRAGKIASGDEAVLKSIRSGQAKLVLIAEDASDNAKKKYGDKCRSFQVPIASCGSRCELGESIGKEQRVAVAVTDPGLAQSIRNCLKKPVEVENIEYTRQQGQIESL